MFRSGDIDKFGNGPLKLLLEISLHHQLTNITWSLVPWKNTSIGVNEWKKKQKTKKKTYHK